MSEIVKGVKYGNYVALSGGGVPNQEYDVVQCKLENTEEIYYNPAKGAWGVWVPVTIYYSISSLVYQDFLFLIPKSLEGHTFKFQFLNSKPSKIKVESSGKVTITHEGTWGITGTQTFTIQDRFLGKYIMRCIDYHSSENEVGFIGDTNVQAVLFNDKMGPGYMTFPTNNITPEESNPSMIEKGSFRIYGNCSPEKRYKTLKGSAICYMSHMFAYGELFGYTDSFGQDDVVGREYDSMSDEDYCNTTTNDIANNLSRMCQLSLGTVNTFFEVLD